MNKLFTLLSFLSLLFIGSSCEDDYRSLVLFEGVEPIYQMGTCNNLISSVTLYMTSSDGVVLGIDGGDGDYTLDGGDGTVASAVFTDDLNGYRRIKVQPKAEGTTNITVRDHSGATVMLQVRVRETYLFHYHVQSVAYSHTGEIEPGLWTQIQTELSATLTMKEQGTYTLLPADSEDPYWGGGELRVQTAPLAQGFLVGTYKMREGESGKPILHFDYSDEVHQFSSYPISTASVRNSAPVPLDMYEDVTSFVSVRLPEGCRVYRVERWMYLPDIIYT